MKGFFLQTQRPEDFESGSHPGQRPGLVKSLTAARQPVSDAGDGLAQKGKQELRAVQAARPAPHCRRVWQAVRILEGRQSLFPRAVFHNALLQRLTARHQTVMRVRKREQWKEGEGRPAASAAAPANPDPVVMLVVRLLAATSVANDCQRSNRVYKSDTGVIRSCRSPPPSRRQACPTARRLE